MVRAFINCCVVIVMLACALLARAEESYDVVVYGGTSGGVIAAVQAARMGKRVVLIEPGKHLGGMTSGGLGATDIGNQAAIGGLRASSTGASCKHYEDDERLECRRRAEAYARAEQSRRRRTRMLDVRAARRREDLTTTWSARKGPVVIGQRLDLKTA